MNKYELIDSDIKGLYRIKALKDFNNVKKGDVGGYIQAEINLNQQGDAWVYDNARVFGKAQVYGNAWVYNDALVSDDARVYSDAQVFGDDIVTKVIYYLALSKDSITVTDNNINIGCKQHTIDYWLEHYYEIGKDNHYLEKDIYRYKKALDLIKYIKQGE